MNIYISLALYAGGLAYLGFRHDWILGGLWLLLLPLFLSLVRGRAKKPGA
jgi:hypothetical protein